MVSCALEFDPLGAIAHEFLNMLGAFDLYGGEGERERFVDDWDIMATGHRLGVELIGNKLIGGKSPTHPSSWTKIRIGWFSAREPTGDVTLKAEPRAAREPDNCFAILTHHM